MTKNWRCIFSHDWEYILKEKPNVAWANYIHSNIIEFDGCITRNRVYKRVCLRCRLKEDTYTPFIKRKEQEIKMAQQRRAEAEKLYKEI